MATLPDLRQACQRVDSTHAQGAHDAHPAGGGLRFSMAASLMRTNSFHAREVRNLSALEVGDAFLHVPQSARTGAGSDRAPNRTALHRSLLGFA